jgi:hypothetical protein
MAVLTNHEIWSLYLKKNYPKLNPNLGVEPDKDLWKRISTDFHFDKKEIGILKKIKKLVLEGTYSENYEPDYMPSYRTSDQSFYNDKFKSAFNAELRFLIQTEPLAEIMKQNGDSSGLCYRLAIEIRENNKEIIELTREAIMGGGDIKLTNEIILGVIKSGYMPLIEDLGKLLLAARGQEGVRQSIIEWCDSGSPATQAYFMKLCVDNNLTRFSSVARALGCFSGVLVTEMRPAAVTKLFTRCYENLINPKLDIDLCGDVTEIYSALWGLGANDILIAKKAVTKVVDSLEKYRRLAGWYFLKSVNNTFYSYDIAIERIDRPDPEELALISGSIYIHSKTLYQVLKSVKREDVKSTKISAFPESFTERRRQYKALGDAVKRIGNKKTVFNDSVFDGVSINLHTENIATTMLSIICYDLSEELKLDFEQYLPFINQLSRDRYYRILLDPKTKKDREILLRGLSDKSVNLKVMIADILGETELSADETDYLIDVLTTVNSELRKSVITVLSKQKENIITAVIDKLSRCKNTRQREAGEELYALISPVSAVEFSAENGFGLYDTNSTLFELEKARNNLPKIKTYKRDELKKILFPDMNDIFLLIDDIKEVFNSHKGEELTCYAQNGSVYQKVYGSWNFHLEKKVPVKNSSITNFHFGDEYYNCYLKSGISPEKLEIIVIHSSDFYLPHRKQPVADITYFDDFRYSKTPDNLKARIYSGSILDCIVEELRTQNDPRLLTFDFCMSIWASFIALIPENEFRENFILNPEDKDAPLDKQVYKINFPVLGFWYKAAYNKIKTDDEFKDLFRFVWYIYLATNKKNFKFFEFEDLPKALSLGLLSEQDTAEILMSGNNQILEYFSRNRQIIKETSEKFPLFSEVYQRVIDRIVSVEEKRGDIPTDVTKLISDIKYYEGGAYHFAALLKALEKEKFHRGYYYIYSDYLPSKQLSLSILLKRCYPKQNDDETTLKAALKKFCVNEKQVYQAIMYAPQWAGLAEKALGINGLKSAVWLFHAHVNESQNAEKETEIAHYSPISIREFADGTFDKDWFLTSYNTVGDKVFGELYKNALYITKSPAAHKRSQMYTDAVLGRLDKKALEAEILEKRGQEKLRAYGLIPIDKRDKNDALHRYEFIQKFIKDSKQFGAQRRASEGNAANIALQNLAISTGFSDVDRMTWNFESEITELTGKELKDQKSRAKASFEKAMTAHTVFLADEIVKFLAHPVLSEFINSLLLISENVCGFPKTKNGKLFLGDTPVSGGVYIAHPYDLTLNNSWEAWQKCIFENEIVQPFKQVFREFYPLTADEREDNFRSTRYAGHQVQPKKAAALLKSRGWTVDYDEGLQKVFHKENLIVRLFAAADWFSPADIEAPTLETIQFTYRGNGKTATLSEIPPILFSEVMRDIDLVVSVANVGGVDPEASASTIEMRIAIARELLSLLKIKNVAFKTAHALVKGHFGDYSVHMGSGIVHQIGVGMIPVLAVQSGQRGHIFLPFADNDPRTAEIVSKILLFADDKKIKDPSILAYRK